MAGFRQILKTVPGDLSKLSNAVGKEVAKNTTCDKLAIKVNAIDTTILRTSGVVTTVKVLLVTHY